MKEIFVFSFVSFTHERNEDVHNFVKLALKIKFGDETDKSHEYDTYPADEAVRMPLTIKRRYIIFHDSAVATTALGCKHVEVILAAIRFAVSLVEALLAELLAALGAEEVFSVPGLLQGGHTFLEKNISFKSTSATLHDEHKFFLYHN
ncbi:hypothetical protein ALC62_15919 [Cyphomyrmex costatus]|uniref:Uncharacterized protein n=1 Tax=Cyphomyrmex costatus TaxID=456900 RepID=A0A195C067_9HYME|nr:hypothetical protein ALC62_15919 [Cyphomyrmex costatus]